MSFTTSPEEGNTSVRTPEDLATPAPENVKGNDDVVDSGALAATEPDPSKIGALGITFDRPEIAGGNITREVLRDDTAPEALDIYALQKKALKSENFRRLLAVTDRGVSEVGLYQKGDVMHGERILVNVDTLEKVRFMHEARIPEDDEAVYMNSRDIPHALSEGDIKANLGL